MACPGIYRMRSPQNSLPRSAWGISHMLAESPCGRQQWQTLQCQLDGLTGLSGANPTTRFDYINAPQVKVSMDDLAYSQTRTTRRDFVKSFKMKHGTQTLKCRMQSFIAPAAGNYLFIVGGARGGNDGIGTAGGFGATVEATAFLQAGDTVTIIVGGPGGLPGPISAISGGGGGGLSAVYSNGVGVPPTIVAGLGRFHGFQGLDIILRV